MTDDLNKQQQESQQQRLRTEMEIEDDATLAREIEREKVVEQSHGYGY